VLVLVLLITSAAAYEGVSLSALNGMDVWSHLSTGIWILQNYAVPHNGLFSQYPDLPWMAHSWGFDVLLASAYKVMGLRALPALLMVFKVALALTFFLLARGSRQNFWAPVSLAALAQYAISGLQLQPVLCSILLCAIELALLFHARRTGNARPLLWLPLLLAIWGNLDIRFVYGVLVLGLLLAAVVVEEVCRRCRVVWLTGQTPAIPLARLGVLTAASLFATLLTPYTYDVYGTALKSFGRSALLAYLPELNAVGFRRPQDYALLLLTMAAFLSLGRRRSRDLFQFALMSVSAMLSFPAQRESWLVAVASVAVIAYALPFKRPRPAQEGVGRWRLDNLVTAGLVLLVLLVAVSRIPSSRDALLTKVGRTLPVRACDYIRENHLPGPLFNAYEWGGFLTWYLPEYAVAIDARNDLYGDEINLRYFKLTHAEIPLSGDVSFVYARTILLQRNAPMAVALSAAPKFKIVYSDDLATVLTPQEQWPGKSPAFETPAGPVSGERKPPPLHPDK
jgi:hypothetical protein